MFSASDIANFLACQHFTTLDRAEEAGRVSKPFLQDPSLDLLRKLGIAHEQNYLAHLRKKETSAIVEIPADIPAAEAAARTVDALGRGVEVVYQGVFHEGPWIGKPDFLIRVDRPSTLGPWSYEIVEAKLAHSTKARALIQLCFYSDLLSRIQGIAPQWMHVVLGGGASPKPFQVQHYIAYFRKVRRDFEAACNPLGDTYPEPVEHCDVCAWLPLCDKRRREDDHLSFVAGITRLQRRALVERDVDTVSHLARIALPVAPKIEHIGDAALLHLREQARLQVKGREEDRLVYELLPVEAEKGLAVLPAPSPGDVFLDLESDAYAFDQGLEFLFGVATAPQQLGAEPTCESHWCLNPGEEKKAFEKLIGTVMKQWQQHPDMHIYHYAPYESTAIKRLAGRHGICVDEVDHLLRAGIFVDLYQVVRQGLRASVESYSIKKLEPLYGFARTVPLRDATAALQSFEAVLALGTDQEDIAELFATIEGYNRDDCVSALRLREWLEDRRRELEAKTGETLPRPTPKSGEPGEDLTTQLEEVRALMERLLADVPPDEVEWTDEHRARWLLAHMLEWHRREDKSAWWEYFRLCALSDDELEEDKSALSGLVYVGETRRVARSIIHRYRFPPQDHAIDRATKVHDPRTKGGAGEVVAIDERNRTIDIKRGASSSTPHPTALIPYEIVGSGVLRDSLLRLGAWVAKHGIDGRGPYQAARDLLLRRRPRLRGSTSGILLNPDESVGEAAKRLALSLEASALPVQGPPGSGKTFNGARMIAELVKNGKRVGITAVSHKVISNLLEEVCRAARESGIPLRAVQKANENDGCSDTLVTQAKNNQEVLDALTSGAARVAAGTAWLWSCHEFAEAVDVLFVDEAGQMSLANVLAVSQGAASLVLLVLLC